MNRADWVPEWAYNAVFYHIYPLGFLDAPFRNPRRDEPTPRLEELRHWYDHIANLGVNAIYFGPIFESGSHGYDTIDYFEIDRRLGTKELFKEIVAELHSQGIKVIVDGVFNHTSRHFFAFEHLRQHRQSSAYKHWYFVNWDDNNPTHDGFHYTGWNGHTNLPKLNVTAHDVREHLYDAVKMWMEETGIDGWRLDVSEEMDPQFWWHFRRVCKSIKPGCLLIGEMTHGNYRDLVNPDQLDSGTNYQLYKALWSSLNDHNYWELKSALDREFGPEFGIYQGLPLFNFLGNHDVTRIADMLDNPFHLYPALIALLTLPGIPALYYGDEVGMHGRKEDGDAALRRPMPAPSDEWPDRDHNIYRETARLIRLRKANHALTHGDYATLQTAHTVFSYIRRSQQQTAVICLNSGDNIDDISMSVKRFGIPDGTVFFDVLNKDGQPYTVDHGRLYIEKLWPGWGRVLVTNNA